MANTQDIEGLASFLSQATGMMGNAPPQAVSMLNALGGMATSMMKSQEPPKGVNGIFLAANFYPKNVWFYPHRGGKLLKSCIKLDLEAQQEYFSQPHIELVYNMVLSKDQIDISSTKSYGHRVVLDCIKLEDSIMVYQYSYRQNTIEHGEVTLSPVKRLCIPVIEAGDVFQDEKYILSRFNIEPYARQNTVPATAVPATTKSIIYKNTAIIPGTDHVKYVVISEDVIPSSNGGEVYLYTYHRYLDVGNHKLPADSKERLLFHGSDVAIEDINKLAEIFKAEAKLQDFEGISLPELLDI